MAEIIKFETESNEQVPDNLFRLEEMVDAMTKSLDNAKRVKHEQTVLLSIIKENLKKDNVDFSEFSTNLEKQIDEMTKQIKVLNHRKDQLVNVIEYAKSHEDTKNEFNKLLSGLGVFGE